MDDVPDDRGILEPDRPSRYAVPMSTLLGGAFVAATDQVEVQPEPPSPDSFDAPAWTWDAPSAD